MLFRFSCEILFWLFFNFISILFFILVAWCYSFLTACFCCQAVLMFLLYTWLELYLYIPIVFIVAFYIICSRSWQLAGGLFSILFSIAFSMCSNLYYHLSSMSILNVFCCYLLFFLCLLWMYCGLFFGLFIVVFTFYFVCFLIIYQYLHNIFL